MLPITQITRPPAKRKRVVLSVETKLQMIERAMNGEKFSKLSREYNISPQTAKDIFNNRNKLVSFAFSSGTVGASLKRKSLKRSSFQDIDKAVYQWFQQQRSEGIPITGPMLIEKALWFHKEMKIGEPFLASSGWLSNFKTRYNIRQPKTKDDKLVAEEPIVDKFKTEFKKIVKHNNFTLDQIYLGDEKTLYWKNIPKINTSNIEIENINTFRCPNIKIEKEANFNGGYGLDVKAENEDDANQVYLTIESNIKKEHTKTENKDNGNGEYFKSNSIHQNGDNVNVEYLTMHESKIKKENIEIENIDNNNREYITILAAANANGTKRLNLFCTGEVEILIDTNSNNTLVNYYNLNKCENPLKDWFHNVFIPVVKEDLKEKALPEKAVLLIINSNNKDCENESAKTESEMEIKSEDGNFFVMNLPKNISELPQMGQVTKDISKYYFKRKLIPMLEDSIKFSLTNLSLSDTLHVISEAWDNVKFEHMQHTSWWWRNLFMEMENEGIIEPNEGMITHFMMTRDNIKAEEDEGANKVVNNCNLDDSINFNNNVTSILCAGKEIEELSSREVEKYENSVASSSQTKIITINEAFNSAGILLTYLEQQDDSSYKDLLSVRNIKKKLKERLSNIFLNSL